MRQRSFFQNAFRAALLGMILLAPQFFPFSVPLIPIFLGALLAYDGADGSFVAVLLGVLLALEFVWGRELGLRSGAFAITVALFCAAERWIAFSPWVCERGWQVAGFVRSIIAVVVLASTMTAATAAIFAIGYGYGMVEARLVLAFGYPFFQSTVVLGAIFLLVLRRIDEPFRRPTPFQS